MVRWWWLGLLGVALAGAAPLRTTDGLTAEADGPRLKALRLDGVETPVKLVCELRDPRQGSRLTTGFRLTTTWSVAGSALRCDGLVEAEGTGDAVADLIVRAEGVGLPLGSMATDPLLLPAGLVGKLPLVSLRLGADDPLALAVPPDHLALMSFQPVSGGVELRFPLGFTTQANAALRRRAPFACVLYRTDPRWHFRAALERYYQLFPKPFEVFRREGGGWFFAASPTEVPNPQHFAFYEGGPTGWQEARDRGMGTYPYRESASATVTLSGSSPKGYDEALRRFDALAAERHVAAWQPQNSFVVDDQVHHGGSSSIRAEAGERGVWAGALQEVAVEPPGTAPVVVEGWSRAAGVTGEPDANYSLYVDCVYADGSYLFGQCAVFPTGTHDWVASRYVIRPTKPLQHLRVFCLLRTHHGQAWFDDLRVGPEAQPAVNWLRNSGFETRGERTDLAYIRDNVVLDGTGHQVVYITDNLSADVGPPQPLNLLRFSLNVDPNLPTSVEHPSVAATEFHYYDDVFRATPALAGCYIDSVSAWSAGVLNTRRDQWPAATVPFTYVPGTFAVATHGRYAMMAYLGALQQRYHPQGKAVFTNIHVDQNSFPLYLTSDVPGIESSQFQDQDALFFYRAASYHKPLTLLNFMNLHHLDQRAMAETYHRNAGQWGLFPSTGRFVEAAYQLYGDVTHAWLPAIADLQAAGWEPVPLADGARVERFGRGAPVYFTVRDAPSLHLPPAAVAVTEPVAWDAVAVRPLPLTRVGQGWQVALGDGEPVRVVRVDSAAGTRRWLLGRARHHLVNATRVKGRASADATVAAWLDRLDREPAAVAAELAQRLDQAPAQPADSFALSLRRELAAARVALGQVR